VKGEAASIDVSRDGKPHLSWTGKQESLSLPTRSDHFPGLDARRPGMSLYHGPTSLNRVRVRLVAEGLAERLDGLCKSIQSDPRNASLLEDRGRLYAHLGRYDDAARDLIRANELLAPPGVWDCYSGLFDFLMQHEEVFTAIAARRRGDIHLWGHRGNYCAARSQWQRALTAYARASDPSNHMWQAHYAFVLLLTGDEDGYRRLCLRMAERFGETEEATLSLAMACSLSPRSGIDPIQIVKWAGPAVTLFPNKLSLIVLGYARYRAGQFDEAVKALEEAVAAPGAMPKGLAAFPMALASHKLGQQEEARKWYQLGVRVLSELAPKQPDDGAPSIVAGAHVSLLHMSIWYREAKAELGLTDELSPPNEPEAPIGAPPKKESGDPGANP
jgi:tetratricopeptide (TPR) repeat protein